MGKLILILGCMFSGKCLGKDTGVLMYDGTIKKVQDIKAGDLLMGDDSTPRRVLNTTKGFSKLYKIIPSFGKPYIVNEHHILSLKCSHTLKKKYKKNQVINMKVTDFMNESKLAKKLFKGYRVGVEFNNCEELELDPYILGAWLGDGTSSKPEITSVDKEIIDYFTKYFLEKDLYPSKRDEISYNFINRKNMGSKINSNWFMYQLRNLQILNNKHIPYIYKCNTKENRLKLLAGLLDTDGYFDKKKNCYEITQKNKKLAKDITFLGRSLGMNCYMNQVEKYCIYKGVKRYGIYYRINISNNLHKIPCLLERKKAPEHLSRNNLLVGIKVEELDKGEYFGFELDKNHLFLLDDFTVTHNTSKLLEYYYKYKLKYKCLLLSHNNDCRYGKNTISTHDKFSEKSQSVTDLSEAFEFENYTNSNVIIIDEGQFFDDLELFVKKAVNKDNKIVIVSGLNSDYMKKPIGDVNKLIMEADDIHFQKAICHYCPSPENAIFSLRINTTNKDQILIGEKNNYVPVCRYHYNQKID